MVISATSPKFGPNFLSWQNFNGWYPLQSNFGVWIGIFFRVKSLNVGRQEAWSFYCFNSCFVLLKHMVILFTNRFWSKQKQAQNHSKLQPSNGRTNHPLAEKCWFLYWNFIIGTSQGLCQWRFHGASQGRSRPAMDQRWFTCDVLVLSFNSTNFFTTNSPFSDLMFQWFTQARMIVADVTSVSSFTVELSSVPTKTFNKSAKTMSPEQPSRRLVHFW